jgi:hypothetical protein
VNELVARLRRSLGEQAIALGRDVGGRIPRVPPDEKSPAFAGASFRELAHGFSPCLAAKKYAARGRSASAQQKARRGVPPGRLGVVSVNTSFWKILVTRVKQKMCDASVVSLSCCPNSGFAELGIMDGANSDKSEVGWGEGTKGN